MAGIAPASEGRRLLEALNTVVLGQEAATREVVIALLARGHVLLEGVPGVAKTLLVRALAASLRLQSKRVQFTPDLMPGDVTGSLIYDARTARFEFREGPIFTNLLLADEINRTPPKTQAALLEAMQERCVTLLGNTRELPDPFFVLATQKGRRSAWLTPAAVTCCSCIASSSAAWVLGGVRLISSASTRLAKIGPFFTVNWADCML